jgi:hypothetical protein
MKTLKLLIIPVIILLVILGVFLVYNPLSVNNPFSPVNNSDSPNTIPPGYGAVNNSQFQLETGWYQNFSTGYQNSAKLSCNGSTRPLIMIIVNQFPDQTGYQQAYQSETGKNDWHIVSEASENQGGVTVKTLQVARDEGSETVKSYFFEKNGKYYQVQVVMGSGNTAQFYSSEKYRLDATVNTIIRTMN